MRLFNCLAFKGVRPFSFATTLALVLGSQRGYTQIPVTVTTQVTDSPMTVAEFASNASRWAQQVQQMTSQIDQMKQQYGALTGSRGLGRVFDDPQLREYLPQDWQAVYDAVKKKGTDLFFPEHSLIVSFSYLSKVLHRPTLRKGRASPKLLPSFCP